MNHTAWKNNEVPETRSLLLQGVAATCPHHLGADTKGADTPPAEYDSRAMDEDSRSVLIGGALFLQSERPTTSIIQDYPWFRRDSSRSHHTFAGLVRGFLDSMALLLVPPGAGAVGCCLDLSQADCPANLANQGAPKHPAPGDTAPATDTKDTKASANEEYPDQEPPTFTLRIARSGQFTASEDQQQKDLATKIISLLQTGRQFYT